MDYRVERDTMGEVRVPKNALYRAQTQRAIDNFQISDLTFPNAFIKALGLIKLSAAEVNGRAGRLPEELAQAVVQAAREVVDGKWNGEFPLDIFQTGSGTSTNMNANEVIASRAEQILMASHKSSVAVHANDHVNMGQSSNDVIPSAIHVSVCVELDKTFAPSFHRLYHVLHLRAQELENLVKTGRTHLMDAVPITFGQEISGWTSQIKASIDRTLALSPALEELPLGGTAVGTGLNAPKDFASDVIKQISVHTGIRFKETQNHFAAQSALDAICSLSGELKTAATIVFKIANDLRWMNSGPLAGVGEIQLPALQPGSSIMTGKINPVIPEAVMMACVKVIGNDLTVTLGNHHSNFQLNTMMPLIAHDVLQSIQLLSHSARHLADKAIKGFTVNKEAIERALERNPILSTALVPEIGYEKATAIAKSAYAEGRTIKEVAYERSGLSRQRVDELLDPKHMTQSP
ncbi:MAG: class II fumarate hydratase [Verrucomicrobiota bacterium]|nr:class II fumarate hydratase [Verrucomicrobiota bacterium]